MAVTHKHLEAFHTVIQTGGFTRAAKQLRTSQPSISRLIAQLQEAVSFPLFARIQGQTVPTEEALVFYREVDRSFTGLDKVLRQAERIRTHRVGHLNILSMPALAQAFLPRVLSRFLQENPGVSASLQVQRSDSIADWMRTHQFDLGFAMLPVEHPGLEFETFDAAPGVCVLPPGHPLAARRVVDVKHLHGVQFVGTGPNSTIQRSLNRLFDEAQVVPDSSIETPITAIACELVANGAGLTIADPFTAHSYRARGLVLRRFRPDVLFHFTAVFPANRTKSLLLRRFLAMASEDRDEIYRELGPSFHPGKSGWPPSHPASLGGGTGKSTRTVNLSSPKKTGASR
jgi:DNA-binding transcriptional LysR family regulator